jgi:hypothetical protein
MGVNLSDVAAGGAEPRHSGGALHSAFSGLSHVGANRLFAGLAFDKMRRPGTQRTLNTPGLKTSLGRSTRTGSRSSPRVSAPPRDTSSSRSKDGTISVRLPSARGGACAPPAATPLRLTRMMSPRALGMRSKLRLALKAWQTTVFQTAR